MYAMAATLFRRLVVTVAIVSLCSGGCSKPVDVPRDQFEAASDVENAPHRITLNSGVIYTAQRFSVTDSTVVVLKLHAVDAHKSDEVPVTLRREDIKSIQKLELDQGKSFFLLAGIGLVVIIVIASFTTPVTMN